MKKLLKKDNFYIIFLGFVSSLLLSFECIILDAELLIIVSFVIIVTTLIKKTGSTISNLLNAQRQDIVNKFHTIFNVTKLELVNRKQNNINIINVFLNEIPLYNIDKLNYKAVELELNLQTTKFL